MEKLVERGLLYDFYGPLLTKHQQEVYEAAVYEDLSLSEIADREGISRQGVHDLLHRCDKSLQEYEEKLGLIERFGRNRKRLEKLKEDLSDPKDRKVIDEILEEL
ncbi:MAG: putative DNA-binding protein [Firmicutes bacterium ADurb.Bin354]|nr:MAG: putative DNA-binding protein [Firmicutes bacterium ADurb.Bin354]